MAAAAKMSEMTPLLQEKKREEEQARGRESSQGPETGRIRDPGDHGNCPCACLLNWAEMRAVEYELAGVPDSSPAGPSNWAGAFPRKDFSVTGVNSPGQEVVIDICQGVNQQRHSLSYAGTG